MYVSPACCACTNPECDPQAGSSELTARLQDAQHAERVASAAGASISDRPAQPGTKLPSNSVPCSKVRPYIPWAQGMSCFPILLSFVSCLDHQAEVLMLHQLSA